MKTCFKCGEEKAREGFYPHPAMADGLLGKCKECTKRDARENRHRRLDYYRAYDRDRGNRQSGVYRESYAERFPEKRLAHQAVSKAVKDGTLTKAPCEVCGTTEGLHAHHDDYSRPLDVRWLCATHHHEHHAAVREAI